MNKKEVTELKRRMKKESCSITKLCGCYVNSSKERVTEFSETFLNLEDEELHKYLDLAGKTLSGTLGNNLMELEFPDDLINVASDILANGQTPVLDGGEQALLLKLKDSKLTDADAVSEFYEKVINSYDYIGNYLILLFHDVYDVPMRATDGVMLEDSETLYEYILCAICPVNLSKPGLGYREDENRIGVRIRDWVVGAVDTGFTFPAFSDRAADIHHILMYAKDAKAPHKEFWENGLGVTSRLTSAEKKNAFTNMVIQTLGPESDDTADTVLDIQNRLNDYIIEHEDDTSEDAPLIMEPQTVAEILTESGVSEEKASKIQEKYTEYFPHDERPEAKELLDSKAMKENEQRAETQALKDRVVELSQRLEDAGLSPSSDDKADIVVKIPADRLDNVTETFIDGMHCLVIPIEDDDTKIINGQTR